MSPPPWLVWTFTVVVIGLFIYFADTYGKRVPYARKQAYNRALAIGFPLLVLVTWELLVHFGYLNGRWFPPPSRILVALWDLITSYNHRDETSLLGRPWLIPGIWAQEGWKGAWALLAESHVLATLFRVAAGFVIGAAPGILVGMAMGLNHTIRQMLDPIMSAIYVLPKIAIFPLMMLVFANPFGEGPKVAVIAITAFFLIAINTMAGVRGIEPVFLEAGRNFGAGRWQMLRHVIIPGALPIIFSGLRIALGSALIVIVAVEFIRAQQGVGFLVFYYWTVLSIDKMYASLFVVMVMGVGLTWLLQWLERKAMPWRG